MLCEHDCGREGGSWLRRVVQVRAGGRRSLWGGSRRHSTPGGQIWLEVRRVVRLQSCREVTCLPRGLRICASWFE
jgi:hypothetical protein